MSSPSKRVGVLDDLEDDKSNASSRGADGDDDASEIDEAA